MLFLGKSCFAHGFHRTTANVYSKHQPSLIKLHKILTNETQQYKNYGHDQSVIAVIPARGGSKGIPRKNIAPLCGKPLIAWTIEAALEAQSIDRVIVSTDDEEISAVALQFGAEVIMRPADISGGSAPSESALLHVLADLKAREQYEPTYLAFLQCTSPLTIAEDIDGCMTTLREKKCNTVITASEFHYFLWKSTHDEKSMQEILEVEGINHDASQPRQMRQDQAPQFIESGAVYALEVEGFLKAKTRFFGKTAIHHVPSERRFEIDEPVDLKVAEVLLQDLLSTSQPSSSLPAQPDALVLDFDGVLTDNKVYVHQDGSESVCCDRSDGHGLAELQKTGIPVLVLSREKNPVVQARCKKLGIPCIYGEDNKAQRLQQIATEKGWGLCNIIYVGNDIPDIEVMNLVGCGVAVADAYDEVKTVADWVLTKAGGNGAVRELSDFVLSMGVGEYGCMGVED